MLLSTSGIYLPHLKRQLIENEFVRELMGNNDLIVSSDQILEFCSF